MPRNEFEAPLRRRLPLPAESTLWMPEGACVDQPALFAPAEVGDDEEDEGARARRKREQLAKAVCDSQCPVRDACGEWALATRQSEGVWGGMSWPDRQRVLRERRTQGRRVA